MRRHTIGLLVTVTLMLLWPTLSSGGPPPGKVPRIGFLCAMAGPLAHTEGFVQGLRDLGYVDGQHITIEYRFTGVPDGRSPRTCFPEETSERFRDVAAEFVQRRVDVIVVASTPAIGPAKDVTTHIPIVMAQSDDPVGSGFVASLARPGGNITGLTSIAPELSGKRLELLKEAVPHLARVAVLANPANPATPRLVRETEVAAQALALQLHLLEVRSPIDFPPAFAALRREGAAALLVLPDLTLFDHIPRLTELAATHRLPAMYDSRQFVEAGGLMAYGPSDTDLFRRTATYVDKILKGAKPADLPVEQPTKFELVINLKTAQALGLTIPPTLLFQADEVIR
jgi:putative tryptophan/tyrosine transport system substrate-binding protein